MSEMTICNGIIEDTSLTIEDHGILTFWLHLKWGSIGQGLGGYCLDTYDKEKKCRVGWGPGLTAIRKILETVGVGKWEQLKGKLIRVKSDNRCGSSRPPIIGHILEEKWFDLKEFMENAK